MVALRDFQSEDFSRLLTCLPTEKDLFQWAGPAFTFPLTAERFGEHLRQPNRLAFTVNTQQEMVGYIELDRINKINGSATICRVLLSPEHRGRGLGSLLMDHMVAFAFEELGLRRLELLVFDFNSPAIAAYKNAGFEVEGRLREWLKCGNEYWDAVQMGILKKDWIRGNKH